MFFEKVTKGQTLLRGPSEENLMVLEKAKAES